MSGFFSQHCIQQDKDKSTENQIVYEVCLTISEIFIGVSKKIRQVWICVKGFACIFMIFMKVKQNLNIVGF